MNIIKYLIVALIFAATYTANAQLKIEDFENYSDEVTLRSGVRSFGMAQTGEPTLVLGKGVNDSNAACYGLAWAQGKSANLNFVNIPSEKKDLRAYSEIHAHIHVQTAKGYASPTNPTTVKLVILGGPQNTVWQTRTEYAIQPSEKALNRLALKISTLEMERIAGSATLEETLADIKNIRLRFENNLDEKASENVYVDSIVAMKPLTSHELSSSAITQVGMINNEAF